MLKIDTIYLTVTDPCEVSADILAKVSQEVGKMALEFSLMSKVKATQELNYKDNNIKVGELVKGCEIGVDLISTHAFLSLNSTAKTVTVTSDKDSSIAIFLDSKLEFTLGTTRNKFEASISIVFGECKLTSLNFSKPSLSVFYKVGQAKVI